MLKALKIDSFNSFKYCKTKAGEQDISFYFLHMFSHFVAVKQNGTLYSGMPL